jgi:epoxide hydrolase
VGRPLIEPFELDVPEAELDELRERLRRTRWPDAETVDDWSQGIPLGYVQELCAYWAAEYDWRRCETRLNGLGQLRTEIDGLGIHFLHVRSPDENAMPLLLTHGWPGSVVEFLKVVEPLRESFHLVIPSLPGYGFSDKPSRSGWGTPQVAAAWAELMARLRYSRYFAQGGDWGATITTRLAGLDAEHVAGIHLNMPLVSPDDIRACGEPTPAEHAALARFAEHRKWGTGYSKQQSTRPQTVGYGLVDSPAAQCAWIVEKFHSWTDENPLTFDELLDNVMLYWLPATGASAARLYWESFRDHDFARIDVPTGVSIFPCEIFPASRRWVERRFRNVVHYNEPPRGGHFAAFEQPELFVDEIRATFECISSA